MILIGIILLVAGIAVAMLVRRDIGILLVIVGVVLLLVGALGGAEGGELDARAPSSVALESSA